VEGQQEETVAAAQGAAVNTLLVEPVAAGGAAMVG